MGRFTEFLVQQPTYMSGERTLDEMLEFARDIENAVMNKRGTFPRIRAFPKLDCERTMDQLTGDEEFKDTFRDTFRELSPRGPPKSRPKGRSKGRTKGRPRGHPQGRSEDNSDGYSEGYSEDPGEGHSQSEKYAEGHDEAQALVALGLSHGYVPIAPAPPSANPRDAGLNGFGPVKGGMLMGEDGHASDGIEGGVFSAASLLMAGRAGQALATANKATSRAVSDPFSGFSGNYLAAAPGKRDATQPRFDTTEGLNSMQTGAVGQTLQQLSELTSVSVPFRAAFYEVHPASPSGALGAEDGTSGKELFSAQDSNGSLSLAPIHVGQDAASGNGGGESGNRLPSISFIVGDEAAKLPPLRPNGQSFLPA
jgi:hypothetical protein